MKHLHFFKYGLSFDSKHVALSIGVHTLNKSHVTINWLPLLETCLFTTNQQKSITGRKEHEAYMRIEFLIFYLSLSYNSYTEEDIIDDNEKRIREKNSDLIRHFMFADRLSVSVVPKELIDYAVSVRKHYKVDTWKHENIKQVKPQGEKLSPEEEASGRWVTYEQYLKIRNTPGLYVNEWKRNDSNTL